MGNQLISLSKLFNQNIFRIPDYQRGYAWTKKEYVEFWNDIIGMSNDHPYYMGVLTIDKIPKKVLNDSTWNNNKWLTHGLGYNAFYIVDGQQRLTSLIILLSIIIKKVENSGKSGINFLNIENIKNKYIAVFKDKTSYYTELFNYDSENSSSLFFTKNVLGLKIFDNDSIKMNKYNQNLLDARDYFTSKLNLLSNDEIESLFTKITTKVVFNQYQISHDIDVFITFETMNNRGKNLSTLELLKNRLIYLSTLFKDDAQKQINMRSEVNNCWKKMYDFLGKNPHQMLPDDDFLKAHTSIYFYKEKQKYKKNNLKNGNIFIENMDREFLLNYYFTAKNIKRNKITYQDITKYIMSLNDCIKNWYIINIPQDIGVNKNQDVQIRNYFMKITSLSRKSRSFNMFMIKNQWPIITLLYFSKVNDTKLRLSFLRHLEKYIFVSSMMIYPYGDYDVDKIYNKMISSDDIEDFPNKLKSINDKIIKSDSFKRSIDYISKESSKKGLYIESQYCGFPLQYILDEYLVSLNDKAKQPLNFGELKKLYLGSTTVEHIYPQKVKGTHWNNNFKEYTQSNKDKIKNSLGNLIAMDSLKNEKIGNKDFKLKVHNGNTGYKYGFVDEKNVSSNEKWTYKEIKDRGKQIFYFINEKWNLKIPRDKMNNFIGIGRVKKCDQ